jgi:hypothetical protein
MPKFDYEDNQLRIAYLINDSVLALTHAISVAASCKSLTSGGPEIFSKHLDPTNQALSILLRGNGQKFLLGRGLYQNPISSHYASVP